MSKFLSNHRVRIRTAGAVALIGALGLGLSATGVGAAPIDNLRTKAVAIEAKLNENGARVAALGEQLNAAQLRLDTAKAKLADAETRIRKAKDETERLRALVRQRSVTMYKGKGIDDSSALFDATDVSEMNRRTNYAAAASAKDNDNLDQLAQARADLAVQQAEAESARQQAQSETSALAAAKGEADAAAAEQRALLGQVQGQMGELVRQAQAQRAATAKPAVGRKNWSGPVPNPSAGASAAVAFARAQLGKPYEYAASGPDTYDCSGLTLRAWQAGGLSLPHYSGAQAAMFPPVSIDQLQPGDLISTGNWAGHIGIWVGGGYIHATHTGDVIKFVSGSGSVANAVRPG